MIVTNQLGPDNVRVDSWVLSKSCKTAIRPSLFEFWQVKIYHLRPLWNLKCINFKEMRPAPSPCPQSPRTQSVSWYSTALEQNNIYVPFGQLFGCRVGEKVGWSNWVSCCCQFVDCLRHIIHCYLATRAGCSIKLVVESITPGTRTWQEACLSCRFLPVEVWISS